MQLIRLEFASFRDFGREIFPRLTRDGLWLASEHALPVGTEVAFEVDLADGFRLLRGRGEVTAVVSEGPPAGRGMALRFRALDAPSRQLVERIVAHHHALGGSRFVLPAEALEEIAEEAEPVAGTESEPAADAAPAAPTVEQPPVGELMVEELVRARETASRTSMVAELQEWLRASGGAPASGSEPEAGERATPAPAPLLTMTGRAATPLPAHRGASRWWWAVAATLAAAGIMALLWRHPPGQRGGGEPAAPPAPTSPVGQTTPAAGSGAAAPEAAAPAIPEPPLPPFERVERMRWTREGEATVVILELDGRATPERWSTERLGGERPRAVVRLLGVSELPRPATLEGGHPWLLRVRSGLHEGPEGAELHLVADLTGAGVRLAGIEAGERSLRLVFLPTAR